MRIGPFFLVNVGECFLSVTPRLPCRDHVRCWTCAEKSERDQEHEGKGDDPDGPSFACAKADFLRGEHEVVGARHIGCN